MSVPVQALYLLLGAFLLILTVSTAFIVCCVLVGIVRTARARLGWVPATDVYLVVADELTDRCPCTEGCDADPLPPLIFHQMIGAPHDAVPLSDRDEDAWALILNGYRNEGR